MPGPLEGLRVLELTPIGPTPMAARLLADLGAEVLQVRRRDPLPDGWASSSLLERGRRVIELDLKADEDLETLLGLVDGAEVLLEGFRPGVAERLGFGPAECLARNPRLVYCRVTGWGQGGPLSRSAGHDLNFLAASGALSELNRDGGPAVAPVNVLGQYGAAGMLAALGALAAVLHARRAGEGQVVDAALLDGSLAVAGLVRELSTPGLWRDERGVDLLSGEVPFYGVYECADGGRVAIGALEEKFFTALLEKLGLAGDPAFADRLDRDAWPRQRAALAAAFTRRGRDEWIELLGEGACVSPVLTYEEAERHPDNRARRAFVAVGGEPQPSPAPRFGATPPGPPRPPRPATPGWGALADG